MTPLEKLASHWEAQAARHEANDAAILGGSASARIRAEMLRETARELREAIGDGE